MGGALTGFIVKLICRAPKRMFRYAKLNMNPAEISSDAEFWEVPPDFDDSMLDVEEASDAHCEERSSPTVSPKEVEMSVVVDVCHDHQVSVVLTPFRPRLQRTRMRNCVLPPRLLCIKWQNRCRHCNVCS